MDGGRRPPGSDREFPLSVDPSQVKVSLRNVSDRSPMGGLTKCNFQETFPEKMFPCERWKMFLCERWKIMFLCETLLDGAATNMVHCVKSIEKPTTMTHFVPQLPIHRACHNIQWYLSILPTQRFILSSSPYNPNKICHCHLCFRLHQKSGSWDTKMPQLTF